jgi:hypothetical protein
LIVMAADSLQPNDPSWPLELGRRSHQRDCGSALRWGQGLCPSMPSVCSEPERGSSSSNSSRCELPATARRGVSTARTGDAPNHPGRRHRLRSTDVRIKFRETARPASSACGMRRTCALCQRTHVRARARGIRTPTTRTPLLAADLRSRRVRSARTPSVCVFRRGTLNESIAWSRVVVSQSTRSPI